MTLIGYTFKNDALAAEALTTPACRIENRTIRDNQRLEFLGDAVLGLLSAESLYAEKPTAEEGSLTVRRTHMVSSAALCAAAARHGLVPLLKRNRGAHPLSPQAKTIADAVEAILGAAYLDGGLPAARQIFDALELTAHADEKMLSANPKGDLQILTQTMTPPRLPVYTLLSTSGTANEPVFTMRVSVEGLGEATATARSHKEAESLAAANLLARVHSK